MLNELVIEIVDPDGNVARAFRINLDEPGRPVLSRNAQWPLRLRARVIKSMTLGETEMRPCEVENL